MGGGRVRPWPKKVHLLVLLGTIKLAATFYFLDKVSVVQQLPTNSSAFKWSSPQNRSHMAVILAPTFPGVEGKRPGFEASDYSLAPPQGNTTHTSILKF